MKRRITNSEMTSFRRCRRKWYLANVRRLGLKREAVTGPMSLGNRVHGALERYYPGTLDDALAFLNEGEERDLLRAPEEDKKIRSETDLARAMVEGYAQWVEDEGADADYELVAVEEALETEVVIAGVDVTLLGKLDQQVRKVSTGEVMFMDHKTVQDFSRVRLLHQDRQMKFYMLLHRLVYGEERATLGALYNMLRKVKRTGSAKPPFYMREEVRHTEGTIARFYGEVKRQIAEMIGIETLVFKNPEKASELLYPSPTRDCGWDCEFFPVCGMMDNPADDAEGLIASLYEIRDPLARYSGDPS